MLTPPTVLALFELTDPLNGYNHGQSHCSEASFQKNFKHLLKDRLRPPTIPSESVLESSTSYASKPPSPLEHLGTNLSITSALRSYQIREQNHLLRAYLAKRAARSIVGSCTSSKHANFISHTKSRDESHHHHCMLPLHPPGRETRSRTLYDHSLFLESALLCKSSPLSPNALVAILSSFSRVAIQTKEQNANYIRSPLSSTFIRCSAGITIDSKGLAATRFVPI
ncbi:hypothetical protein F5887DRAFT_36690 [Amanita rubescens]|nr:hypothetical protein F5887DRAFT_36690 [Amanita rubescens]